MINTIKDFKRKMDEISIYGWIKTHRSGPTGVGKTLEDLLGITENNLSEPDFGLYELKAARDTDSSMLTLFTKAPKPPRVNNYLLNKYGYTSDNYDNTKKVLHSTLSANIDDTVRTLFIKCSDEKIILIGNETIEEAYWERNQLRDAFYRKYKKTLIYVKAKSRNSGKDEEFLYYEAYELSDFDYERLMELLEKGVVKIDIRIGQYPNGKPHDHGTAFRIEPKYFEQLFMKKVKIWSR